MNESARRRSVIVAIDLGTTSTKVLVIETDSLMPSAHAAANKASILVRTEYGYPLETPEAGAAVQDPEAIAAAAANAVKDALVQAQLAPDEVAAVTFSSAMHALIAVDEQGNPLTPCLTWADSRSAKYARELREQGRAAELCARTGVPVHAMTPLCKLMWLREVMPNVFRSAAAFIGIKEFVLSRWFEGPYAMDESVAGGTGLYNLHSRTWDPDMLQLAGVEADRLPQLFPVSHVMQGMRPEAAASMGLSPDVTVVLGGADGVLANLGAGALKPGIAAVTVGTSGAVRTALREPRTDPEGRLFCYPLDDGYWIAGGPVNSGGMVFRWVRDKLAPDLSQTETHHDDAYDRLVRLAQETPPGADGLLFLPHLAGERAPIWDENARGVFFGLTLEHDRRHMIRASLEGIVFGLRSVAETAAAFTGPLREIRVSGGFARSEAVRQLMADMLGCPLTLADSEESSAIGAARLALYALGRVKSLSEFTANQAVTDRCEPDPVRAAVYARLFPQFRQLQSRLRESFGEIADYQRAEQRH
jgi:gluconokinase